MQNDNLVQFIYDCIQKYAISIIFEQKQVLNHIQFLLNEYESINNQLIQKYVHDKKL